jgi:hypothetical protein
MAAEEAVYWTTMKDGTEQKLNDKHGYVLHFPSGELPPNDAFWSLTMTDAKAVLAANPIDLSPPTSRVSLKKHAPKRLIRLFYRIKNRIEQRIGSIGVLVELPYHYSACAIPCEVYGFRSNGVKSIVPKSTNFIPACRVVMLFPEAIVRN